jgi:aspartyl protease family protein
MKSRWLWIAALVAAPSAHATDVNVIGLFPGKVVVVINRGAPRTLAVGEKTAEGVRVISMDSKGAVLEIDGKREALEMGQHFESAADTGARQSVTMARDERGQFMTDGKVNGAHVRFLVDTGATIVAIPIGEARRLAIDYMKGTPGYAVLADGRRVASYRVVLDSVTVGGITLYNVEGAVTQGSGMPLLGMSFLNRMEMRNEGQSLTLTKRY